MEIRDMERAIRLYQDGVMMVELEYDNEEYGLYNAQLYASTYLRLGTIEVTIRCDGNWSERKVLAPKTLPPREAPGPVQVQIEGLLKGRKL